MTKKDIVARLVKEAKLTQKEATAVVNQFIIDFKDSLSKGVGSQAKFVGIGTWKVYERKATSKKNPKTKEVMFIPAKNAVQFKVGSDIKERVNTPENIAKVKESLAKKAEVVA
jgi:DNA-binding protein HU-beta